ncbi:MAG: hypothetical protein A3H23_01355 [Planctomycetes bacterium RIFCSPLOWO2_12_FULL_40_19]|nr:MAG: hypothetical protein A3H23_01355 [Planctomycetes bacterium RIFCSPLOWO2_12_FULL_40_19]
MKIRTSKNIHSSLKSANFNRYYEDSQWHKNSIQTLREIGKGNGGKAGWGIHDDQSIKSRTPSEAFSRH